MTEAHREVLIPNSSPGAPIRRASSATLLAEGRGARVFDSIVNIITNVVGAGFVTLAFCLQQVGLGVGLALMLATCALNAVSAVMIAECCEVGGSFDFLALGERAFGVAFGRLVQVTMAVYALGSCISYIVLIGDFFTPYVLYLRGSFVADLLPDTQPAVRLCVITAAAVIVLLPLSLRRNLHSLWWSSGLGVLAMMYTTVMVVCRERNDGAAEGVQLWQPSWVGLFEVLPIYSVAFTAHYNMPRYYSELGELRSRATFSRIIGVSFGAVFVCCALTAAFGYMLFGGAIQGNLLTNFAPDDLQGALARVGLGLVVIAAFALVLHSLRASVETLAGLDAKQRARSSYRKLHLPLTAGLIAVSLVIAAYVPHVEVILGYKGAVAGTLIVYVFPGLLYWKLKAPSHLWPLAFAAFGVVVACLGTLATTLKLLRH